MSKALRPGNSSNNTQNAAGRPDTEVPSYFLSELISNGATWLGNAVSAGANALGNAVSNIPVVGNVVDGVVSSVGNGLGQVVSGNVVDGLGSMYHGLDKAVGGFLPNVAGNGIAPAQGWVSSLYNTADQALYGALPNVGGGFGTTALGSGGPSTLFNGLSGENLMYKNVGGEWVAQAPVQSGGGFWDTAGKIANTANIAGSLYGMLQGPKGAGQGAGNAQAQYRQMTGGTPGTAIRPGVQGSGTGSNAGVGVGGKGGANSRGQGTNETGGLTQIRSGISESEAIMQETKNLIDDFKKFMDENKGDLSNISKSPMEEARDKTPLTPDPYANSPLGSAYSMLR